MTTGPSKELHQRLGQLGHQVDTVSVVDGANEGDIAFVEVVNLPAGPAVVLTYRSGMWDAFTPSPEPDTEAIIADVIERSCEPAKGWMSPEEFAEFDG